MHRRSGPTSNNSRDERRIETRLSAEPAQPLVSVVIPTHNRPELLARAIQSVQSQTYPNLEIVVVDDGSDDRTRAVVERAEDPRVRWIRHASRKGGAAARNTGISASRGDVIAFLDDDDEWRVDKVERQLRLLETYDVVTCTSDAIGEEIEKHRSRTTVTLEDLRRGEGTFGGTGVLMAKAEVLKRTMFDESLSRYQDWDLFIRLAQRHIIGYLNEPLLHSNSGSHLRITNSIVSVPFGDWEQQFSMVHKHREFFGARWYRRHMCRSLLWGIKRRPDKFRVVLYIARRYGVKNLLAELMVRAVYALRGSRVLQ